MKCLGRNNTRIYAHFDFCLIALTVSNILAQDLYKFGRNVFAFHFTQC